MRRYPVVLLILPIFLFTLVGCSSRDPKQIETVGEVNSNEEIRELPSVTTKNVITVTPELSPSPIFQKSTLLPATITPLSLQNKVNYPKKYSTSDHLLETIQTPTQVPLMFCSPLRGYSFEEIPLILSNPFEMPRPGHDDGHHGIDLAHWRYKGRASLEGAIIQSVLPGIVSGEVINRPPYGNMIIIETVPEQIPVDLISLKLIEPGNSLYSLYAHMGTYPHVNIGESVQCGQEIGEVGNTGNSGNPHLHFELRIGPSNMVIGPMAFYDMKATEDERNNYILWRKSGTFIPFDPMIYFIEILEEK